ncbi:hypothetical protein ANTQUA_LOCUS6767 [Anthophora quadrimaculata]
MRRPSCCDGLQPACRFVSRRTSRSSLERSNAVSLDSSMLLCNFRCVPSGYVAVLSDSLLALLHGRIDCAYNLYNRLLSKRC